MENIMLITSGNQDVISNRYSIVKRLYVEEVGRYLRDYQTVIDFIQQGISNGISNIGLVLNNKVYDSIVQILYNGGLYGLVKVWILPEFYFDKAGLKIEQDFLFIDDYNKPRLESFQVHLTDMCNLNCKGCGHFSNIAKEPISLELGKYRDDLQQLRSMFWGVERIYLLGGEPLLYQNISEVIKQTRRIFPDSEIHITTNGLLLPKMEDNFFDVVNMTKSHIEISMYPKTYENREEISNVLEKHDLVNTTIIWGRVVFTKKMLKRKHKTPQKSFDNCYNRKNACYFLQDGKLAKCPMMLLIDIFDKEYGIRRECKKEYIDLYKDKIDGWKALELLNRPSEMCSYCAETPQEFEWDIKSHNDAKAEDWFVEE